MALPVLPSRRTPVMGIIQYPPSGSGTSNVGHELKKLIIQALMDMNCQEIIMVVQPDYSVRVSQAETIPVSRHVGSLLAGHHRLHDRGSGQASRRRLKRAKKKAASREEGLDRLLVRWNREGVPSDRKRAYGRCSFHRAHSAPADSSRADARRPPVRSWSGHVGPAGARNLGADIGSCFPYQLRRTPRLSVWLSAPDAISPS